MGERYKVLSKRPEKGDRSSDPWIGSLARQVISFTTAAPKSCQGGISDAQVIALESILDQKGKISIA